MITLVSKTKIWGKQPPPLKFRVFKLGFFYINMYTNYGEKKLFHQS